MKHFKYNKNYSSLTDKDTERLVRIIKNGSWEMGIFLMKGIHDSFYKALNKRRVFTKVNRPDYKWLMKTKNKLGEVEEVTE